MIINIFTSILIGGFLGFFIAMTIDAILNSNKTWTRDMRNSVMYFSLIGTVFISFVWLSVF
jgi:hypothetical protein